MQQGVIVSPPSPSRKPGRESFPDHHRIHPLSFPWKRVLRWRGLGLSVQNVALHSDPMPFNSNECKQPCNDEILQLFMTGPKFGLVINSEETSSFLYTDRRYVVHLQTMEIGIEGGIGIYGFFV
ncbi:hypothetical protein CEXT_26371 [Caerostris extrusa]|uniref:Uncharacterized protein n=1 Tax=Caerostris extrusa TaxID=172846 RepID=A0AAV4VEU8_CAEEX|nr:hypothetical protein CEXT_26371 [Caerostris extrusa]